MVYSRFTLVFSMASSGPVSETHCLLKFQQLPTSWRNRVIQHIWLESGILDTSRNIWLRSIEVLIRTLVRSKCLSVRWNMLLYSTDSCTIQFGMYCSKTPVPHYNWTSYSPFWSTLYIHKCKYISELYIMNSIGFLLATEWNTLWPRQPHQIMHYMCDLRAASYVVVNIPATRTSRCCSSNYAAVGPSAQNSLPGVSTTASSLSINLIMT